MNSRVEGKQVCNLEEALRKGNVTDLLAVKIDLDPFFNVNHKGCLVTAGAHALKHGVTEAVRGSLVAEVQRRFSTNQKGACCSVPNRYVRLFSDTSLNC